MDFNVILDKLKDFGSYSKYSSSICKSFTTEMPVLVVNKVPQTLGDRDPRPASNALFEWAK